MLYVEDDIRMLASERSHGMGTNVWGEQRRCKNTDSVLLVNIRRHRTGGEVLCVCEVKFWEWWKCTSLGFCRLCKSRSLINQRRFLRYPCCLLLSLLSGGLSDRQKARKAISISQTEIEKSLSFQHFFSSTKRSVHSDVLSYFWIYVICSLSFLLQIFACCLRIENGYCTGFNAPFGLPALEIREPFLKETPHTNF